MSLDSYTTFAYLVKARWRRVAAFAIAVACLALVVNAEARAAAGIAVTSFDAELTDYQAGGHPDARTSFRFDTEPREGAGGDPATCPINSTFWPDRYPDGRCQMIRGGAAKDITVELPPGLLGNPRNVRQQCEQADLNFVNVNCPVPSQVGIADLCFIGGGGIVIPCGQNFLVPDHVPLYNMVPDRGEVAKLGMRAGDAVTATMSVKVAHRDGEYTLVAETKNIVTGFPIWGVDVEIWGDPYSSVNDPDRMCRPSTAFGCAANTPRAPFMVAPTRCGTEDGARLAVRDWLHRGDRDWVHAESTPREVHGCDRLQFDPNITLRPTSTRADSPTGLDVHLDVPQSFSDPTGLETPPLKDVAVTLPAGMTVSPSSASGLGACEMDQIGIAPDGTPSDAPVRCPDSSRIGSITVQTPVLEETLSGGVFLAKQSANPFGSLLALYLSIENAERGIRVKIPGKVIADPATGQLTATFEQNPQFPVSAMRLRFKDGPRAPLMTPPSCGKYSSRATLSSWAGQELTVVDSFQITAGPTGGPCPSSGFAPAMSAGSLDPTAGTFSPFSLRLTKADGQQDLRTVRVTLPRGVTGKIADVPYCPESVLATFAGGGTAVGTDRAPNTAPGTGAAEAASPACPAASRVGKVTVGAGSGPAPLFVETGRAYLAGPYKGAPLSLAVVVPAIAGPFDLGNVLVRSAIHVDRRSAQLTVASDDIPTMLEGIPLEIRDLRVEVDRARFAINPTDCRPKTVDAVVGAAQGAAATLSSRFRVGDCAALRFKPRLGLRLVGKRQRTTGRHPAIRAVVRQSGVGEAGIRRARVVLPGSLALDPDNAQALCEFEDGTKPDLEKHCPAGSKVGRARAKSPLLKRDLVGDVYFVKNVRRDPETGNLIRTLPMLVVALRGEIAINLVGKSSTTRSGRLVNTFAGVPDAPIRRFNLNIRGGSNGILAVTGNRNGNINLCAKPRSHRASTGWRGHNGKRASYRVRVKTPCGKVNAKRRA